MLSEGEAEVLAMWMRRHHDYPNIELRAVLYDEYRTGGAYDSPTQNTVNTHVYMYICSAQFANLRNFEIALHKLEIAKLLTNFENA